MNEPLAITIIVVVSLIGEFVLGFFAGVCWQIFRDINRTLKAIDKKGDRK